MHAYGFDRPAGSIRREKRSFGTFGRGVRFRLHRGIELLMLARRARPLLPEGGVILAVAPAAPTPFRRPGRGTDPRELTVTREASQALNSLLVSP